MTRGAVRSALLAGCLETALCQHYSVCCKFSAGDGVCVGMPGAVEQRRDDRQGGMRLTNVTTDTGLLAALRMTAP